MREILRVMDMLYILIVVVVTQVHMLVKAHLVVPLKLITFVYVNFLQQSLKKTYPFCIPCP